MHSHVHAKHPGSSAGIQRTPSPVAHTSGSSLLLPPSRFSPRAAFSLIEMLVAMTILLVIMMMLAIIFNQSNVAWETGFREVDKSMQGRSALNLISREFSQAVADQEMPFSSSGNSLSFYAYQRASATNRAVYQVTYALSGTTLNRTELGGSAVAVLEDVNTFSVQEGPAGSSSNLPAWVELQLALEDSTETARIRVMSMGRNDSDPSDDIKSWE